MIKILFIINPISGIGKQKNITEKIESYIDKDKFDYSIIFTEYIRHATEIAKKAVDDGFEAIAVIGGDGSINDVANALINTDVALGIIPAGSGNGLARYLKIPLSLMRALKVINNYKVSKIDTIKVSTNNFERFYTSIAGIGFDAHVAKKFSLSKIRGFNTYMNIIITDYPNYKTQEYTLILDNKKEIHTKALLISFANSNQYGFNAAIAPNASITDGYIDISVAKKIPLVILPFISQMLWTNTVYYSNYVKNYKAKKVKLISKDSYINIDGESFTIDEKVYFENYPNSLKIIIP